MVGHERGVCRNALIPVMKLRGFEDANSNHKVIVMGMLRFLTIIVVGKQL